VLERLCHSQAHVKIWGLSTPYAYGLKYGLQKVDLGAYDFISHRDLRNYWTKVQLPYFLH